MSKAKTPQDMEVAQSIYKRAEAFAQESMQAAKRTNDTLAQEDAERAIEAVMQSELTAQKRLPATSNSRPTAAQAAADEEQRVTRMRELAKGVAKEMDLFDKKGHPWRCGPREGHRQDEAGLAGIPKPDVRGQEVGGLRLAQLRLHETQDAGNDGRDGHEGRNP